MTSVRERERVLALQVVLCALAMALILLMFTGCRAHDQHPRNFTVLAYCEKAGRYWHRTDDVTTWYHSKRECEHLEYQIMAPDLHVRGGR